VSKAKKDFGQVGPRESRL